VETMVIDSKTLIIKSDNKDDLFSIIDTVAQKKQEHVENLLAFVAKHRIKAKGYKFKRDVFL